MKGNTRKANDNSLNQNAAGAGSSSVFADRQEAGTEIVQEAEGQQQEEGESTDGQYLHTVLGISNERSDQIAEAVNQKAQLQAGKPFDITQLMKDIVSIPQNTEEALYIGFVANNAWQMMQRRRNPLMKLFESLGKGSEE